MEQNRNKTGKRSTTVYQRPGISVDVALGLILGTAVGQVGAGLALGVAVGLGVGRTLELRAQK